MTFICARRLCNVLLFSIQYKISQKYFCIYLAAIRFCLICRQAPRRLLLSATQDSSDRIIRKLGCIAITEVCGEVKERMCKRHAQQNLFLVTVVVVGNRHNRAGRRCSKHCDSFCLALRCSVTAPDLAALLPGQATSPATPHQSFSRFLPTDQHSRPPTDPHNQT